MAKSNKPTTKKNPVGRPKENPDDSLPKDWDKTILSLYEVGASDVEIKRWIYRQRGSFSNDLWERWNREHQKFSDTIKTGHMLAHAWWLECGRLNVMSVDAPGSAKINTGLWYINMKNRFGWADKVDNKISSGNGESNVFTLKIT